MMSYFSIKTLRNLITLFVSVLFTGIADADVFSVKSPDGNIEAKIETGNALSLSILMDGTLVIDSAKIGLNTDKGNIDGKQKPISTSLTSHSLKLDVPFGIRSKTEDKYNLLTLSFPKYDVLLRASDDGVAYRFITKFGNGKMIVNSEILDLNPSESQKTIAHAVSKSGTSFEDFYLRETVKGLEGKHSISLPFVIVKDNCKIVLAESALSDFPLLRLVSDNGLKAYHSKYPKTTKPNFNNWKNLVESTEDYIAKTDASRTFPWRAFIIARNDADLPANDMVFRLAEPCKIKDLSWITAGNGTWDIWSRDCDRGYKVFDWVKNKDFEEFIDFASDANLSYLLFDAGWVKGLNDTKNLVNGNLAFDVRSAIEYAHSKGIKIVLWVLSKDFESDPSGVIARVLSLGADGLKVDFFDRDDQVSISLLEKIAALTAKHKLVVDFHGCPPPFGLNRTYPNVVGFEAVRGHEYNMFSNPIPSEHSIDIMFTRTLAGPLDYTPGAMTNLDRKTYKRNNTLSRAMGTRSAQVAMFVMYYAPFQVLSDYPNEYKKNPETLKFITSIPTTWDESVALEGKIGEYITLARRKGDVWYIAGMNKDSRSVELDFSKLLKKGDIAVAEFFRDCDDTLKDASKFTLSKMEVSGSTKLKFDTASDGGFVIKLTLKKDSLF